MFGRILIVGFSIFAVAGCGNRSPEPASVAEVSGAETSADGERDDRPRHIYYDLTHYRWYAHAEPMIIEQRRYGPRGEPQVIPLAKLRLSGNYQGVDYYVLHGEREPVGTVYVPVYEGYWLPFIAGTSTGD